jgi:hypothetical protein
MTKTSQPVASLEEDAVRQKELLHACRPVRVTRLELAPGGEPEAEEEWAVAPAVIPIPRPDWSGFNRRRDTRIWQK